MKFDRKRMINRVVAVITLFCMATQTTFAAFVSLATVPLFIGTSVPPMVMLNVPKDHQMFGKLYNDFADVNDDGVTDTGYDHTIDYYGYFDSFKCYTYTSSRFEPISNTPDKLCNAAPATNQWSGLYFGSMTSRLSLAVFLAPISRAHSVRKPSSGSPWSRMDRTSGWST